MARIQKLTEAEIQERLAGLSGWAVEEGFLKKKFRFKGFMDGIAFVNKVAEVAEEMDHHPDIYLRFGLVTIALVTHEAKGITERDFQQAARFEDLV